MKEWTDNDSENYSLYFISYLVLVSPNALSLTIYRNWQTLLNILSIHAYIYTYIFIRTTVHTSEPLDFDDILNEKWETIYNK